MFATALVLFHLQYFISLAHIFCTTCQRRRHACLPTKYRGLHKRANVSCSFAGFGSDKFCFAAYDGATKVLEDSIQVFLLVILCTIWRYSCARNMFSGLNLSNGIMLGFLRPPRMGKAWFQNRLTVGSETAPSEQKRVFSIARKWPIRLLEIQH